MKPILRIALLLILLGACTTHVTHNGADSTGSDRGDTLSLTARAWIMRDSGACASEFLAVQQMAVDQLRRGESPDPAVAVLDQMGLFSYVVGDFVSAADYYREAIDSLSVIPFDERPEEAIQLFGDISLLYSEIGMTDEAVAYSDSAIAQSICLNGRLLPDVYRFRSDVLLQAGDTAGALQCFSLALDAIDKYPTMIDKDTLRRLVECGKASMMLCDDNINPADLQWAVSTLERSRDFDWNDASPQLYHLGLGYVRQGYVARGISLMEQSVRELAARDDLDALHSAMTGLMDVYACNGMGDKIAGLYPRYMALNDSLLNIKKAHFIIGARIRHNAEIHANNNRLLGRQLMFERRERTRTLAMVMLLVLTFVMGSLLFYRQYREVRKVSRKKDSRITKLTHAHNELSNQVKTLRSNINGNMYGNSRVLAEPHHLDGEEQGKFRRAFVSLYPHFIEALKNRFPALTPNDELLCMLIYLKHTTAEITVFLGISHTSVNTARYRLRQKLNLTKEQTLDDYLAKITPPISADNIL